MLKLNPELEALHLEYQKIGLQIFYKIRDQAINIHTPIEILVQLSQDQNDSIRSRVAENISTPATILTQLATDSNFLVRCGVAKNIFTPPEVLTQLAQDTDWLVRYWVANNIYTPLESLVKLSQDISPSTKEEAQKTLDKLLNKKYCLKCLEIRQKS